MLHNARRHGIKLDGADPMSSARYFDGWSRAIDRPPPEVGADPPTAPAETELLRRRWNYIGLIDPTETPRGLKAR